jgi:hypothetical protein
VGMKVYFQRLEGLVEVL